MPKSQDDDTVGRIGECDHSVLSGEREFRASGGLANAELTAPNFNLRPAPAWFGTSASYPR